MKRFCLQGFILLLMVTKFYSQGVGISENVIVPHSSSILEISSTNKGLLIPRVALVQTTVATPVTNPATSLLVYNTATVNDVTPGFYYWDGTKWVRLLSGTLTDAWALQGNSISGTEFIGTTNNQPFRIFTNNQERMRITPQGGVGIGTTAPHGTAILEMQSTEKGVLIPRMTQAQRNAITNPADVLLIFNTTTRCFEWWDALNNVWVSFACGTLPKKCLAFGGPSEEAGAIVFASGDEILIGGRTQSFGQSQDAYFLRLDANYNIQWSLVVGGNSFDVVWSNIIKTTDGSFVGVGYTYSYGPSAPWGPSFFIVKVNPAGTLDWARVVGGTGADSPASVVQTSDGGFAIAGWGNSFWAGGGGHDFYIVKLNAGATAVQWGRAIGGAQDDWANFIRQTSDGGYIVGGYTSGSFGAGSNDIMIVKLDASGNLQWARTIGGVNDDNGVGGLVVSDGYIFIGQTNSYGHGGYDILLFKLDLSGNLQWARAIGGTGNETASSIKPTSDGGYIIAARTNSFGAGNFDAYLIKLNSSFNIQWTKTFGGTNEDFGWDVLQKSTGDYIFATATMSHGAGNRDIGIYEVGSDGTSCCATGSGGNIMVVNPTVTVINPGVGSGGDIETVTPSVTTGGTRTVICQ